MACALFISTFKKLKTMSPEAFSNGLKLARLLQETRVSMVCFFDDAPKIASLLEQPEDVLLHLTALKQKFEVITVVFRQYQQIWGYRIELLESCGCPATSPSSGSGAFELGWHLYLLAKAQLGTSFLCKNNKGVDDSEEEPEQQRKACVLLITATVGILLEHHFSQGQKSALIDALSFRSEVSASALNQAWDAVKNFASELIPRGILALTEYLENPDQPLLSISGIASPAVCQQNLLSLASEYERCTQSLALKQQHKPSPALGPYPALVLHQLDERFVVSVGVRILMPSLVLGPEGIEPRSPAVPVTPASSQYNSTQASSSTYTPGHVHAPSGLTSLSSNGPGWGGKPTAQIITEDLFTSPAPKVEKITPFSSASKSDIFEDLRLVSPQPSHRSFLNLPDLPYSQTQTPASSSLGSVFDPSPSLSLLSSSHGGVTDCGSLDSFPPIPEAEVACWMQSIDQLSSEPSEDLHRFFNNCKKSPTRRIKERCHIMLCRINPDNGGLEVPGSVEATFSYRDGEDSRDSTDFMSSAINFGKNIRNSETKILHVRKLSQALYFTVLEKMLKKESARLKSFDHSLLLNLEGFHKGLLACSVEVILKVFDLPTLGYPRLLDLFDVQAFDVFKVIESFVRSCTSLPSLLKKHLAEIEVQIQEKRAWAEESPLFRLIEEQRLAGPWPLPSFTHDWEQKNPDLPVTVGNPFRNTPARQSPHRPPTSQARTTSLDFFFRKLLNVVAQRIDQICTKKLGLGDDIRNQVWTTIKYCLAENNSILRNRHLDQVILCSIYSICKVNKTDPEVTFRNIIEIYKELHLNSTRIQVIREIPLDPRSNNPANQRGDVISFYNKIYIGKMKAFVLQFQLSCKLRAENAASLIQTPADAAERARALQGFQQLQSRITQAAQAPLPAVQLPREMQQTLPPSFISDRPQAASFLPLAMQTSSQEGGSFTRPPKVPNSPQTQQQDNKNKTNTKPIRNDFRNNLINFPAQFVKRPKTDGEFAQGSNSVQIKQEDGFPASSTAVKQESFPFSVR